MKLGSVLNARQGVLFTASDPEHLIQRKALPEVNTSSISSGRGSFRSQQSPSPVHHTAARILLPVCNSKQALGDTRGG